MRRLVVATLAFLATLTAVHTFAQSHSVGNVAHSVVARTWMVGTIQGNALTATNAQLTDAPIRLRDARTGRTLDQTKSDRTGLFAFHNVQPGNYVVEIVDSRQQALAASEILNVNAGDFISAVVKLPFRVPPFAGVLGHSASSAIAIAATAAASGVLATQVVGQDVSPRR